jgi:glycosyltransferase involved in cell wall biosynthesis
MKIVHVTSGLGLGGAEGVLCRLCLDTKDLEHVVVALSLGESRFSDSLRDSGIKVLWFNLKSPFFLFILLKVILSIRSERPDLIQGWMYHGDLVSAVAGLFLRLPVAWNVRHSNIVWKFKNVPLLAITFINAILSWFVPAQIFTCSKEAIRSHGKVGYCMKKFTAIPNGFDRSKFVLHQYTDLPYTAAPLTFGMLARFHPQKGHSVLLEACKMLQRRGMDFRLVLGGPSVDAANRNLMDIIDKYDLSRHVELVGEVTNGSDFMQLIDVHILSSTSGEGFPNVVAEACLCGLVTIVTDVGDSSSVSKGTGWVVQPGCAKELADAMEDILLNYQRSDLSKLGRQARKKVSEVYSLSRMSGEYRTAWSAIVANQ